MANSYSFLVGQFSTQGTRNKKSLLYLRGKKRLESRSKLSIKPLKTLGDSKGHPVANRPYERHTLKDILNAIKVYEGYKKTGEIAEWGTEQLKLMKEEVDIRMKEYSDKQKLSKSKSIPTTVTIGTSTGIGSWTNWTAPYV